MAYTAFSMHARFGPSTESLYAEPICLRFDRPLAEEIKEHFRQMPDLSKVVEVYLPGNATTAVAVTALLETAARLLVVPVINSADVETSRVNLDEIRFTARVARTRLGNLGFGEDKAVVINGADRDLSPAQILQIEEKLGKIVQVLNIAMGHIDMSNPCAGVLNKILDTRLTQAALSSAIFVPPGNSVLAAIMATTIYGLSEVWPQTISFARQGTEFVVAEIVDIHDFRQLGISLRANWSCGEAPVPVSRELLMRVISELGENPLARTLSKLL